MPTNRCGLAGLFVLASLGIAQPGLAQTMEAALARAYAANPTLNAERASLRVTNENVPQALSGYRPTIVASADIGASITDARSPGLGSATSRLGPRGAGVQIDQTIFDGGRLASQVRAQKAATDGAFAAYKQSVLGALEDVENGMASLDSARRRKIEFATAYEASNNAAILARSQYQSGLIDFQTLSSSETTLLNARNSLASAQSDEILAIAQLYNALGGGWQNMDDRPHEQ